MSDSWRSLSEIADLRMGETIIASACDGLGLPIYSADTGDTPWNYSTAVRRRHDHGTIIVGARGSIGYPRMPDERHFGATQTTITLTPRSSDIHARFLLWALRWTDFRRLALQQAIPMLTVADLGRLQVPQFSVREQTLITEVLDTLDTQIRRTEQVIAKLEQIKQGLLTDLLTRGIDENGELRPPPEKAPHLYKDSPVGYVPNNWSVYNLSKVADLQVGYAFKSEWFEDTGMIPLLRGDNVGYGSPDWSVTKYIPTTLAENFSEYLLTEGDVIIGMDRTFTKLGVKISTINAEDVPSLLVQRVGRFRATGCSALFLRCLLLSARYHERLLVQEKGMDIPHLSKREILAPKVAVPPALEQAFISSCFSSIENRLTQERRQHKVLQLLKNGIMDDLLTGRARVTRLLQQAERAAG